MPSSRATRRASSTASLPQHEPKRRAGSSESFHGQTRMVTPITSKPRSTRSAAATDESTPPDMPTMMREDIGLMILGAPAQQFAEPPRELFLRPAELREQLLIGLGLLHRIQILAEEVFHEGDLEALRIGRIPHDSRNTRQTGLARGPPAPFTGNQLITVSVAAHDDWLNHAGGLDRCRELVARLGIHELSWLVRVDVNLVDRDIARRFVRPRHRGQQRIETPPEAALIHVGSPRE